jgi:hypothetical protein
MGKIQTDFLPVISFDASSVACDRSFHGRIHAQNLMHATILCRTCFHLTVVMKCGERDRQAHVDGCKKTRSDDQTYGTARKRATISFPPLVYETLEVIAKGEKSVAGVDRARCRRKVNCG